jgi:Tfp pilus assembly protein PilV
MAWSALMDIYRRKEGFTFNEVLVAMNIVVVAVLGYSLSTVGVIRGQTVNDNFTVALHLAEDKLEQLKAQANLVNDNRCPAAGDHGLSPTGAPGGIFERCWRIGDSSLSANLKQVDVTVSWRDHDDHEIALSTLIFAGEHL